MSRVLAVVLLLAMLLAACETEETPDETTLGSDTGNEPTVTVEKTGETPGEEDQLQSEAAEYCPNEFLGPCTESYIAFATGSRPAALCVNDEDRWFFETPNGDVGDPCTDAGTEIVTIVGGE